MSYTQSGRYTFDFAPSGLFTLVDQQGEPLYEKALPLFEKLMSHLVWIFVWLTLILLTRLFFPWTHYTDYALMACVFVHLFLFGCRLTTLLITASLTPILFPPLWVRLTRKLQKKPSLTLLKKYHLDTHPGLLTNLALVQYSKGDTPSAQSTLQLALRYAPNHPFLLHFSSLLNA